MNILITGKPGIGKTTVIRKIIAGCPNVEGFFTGEIRENRKRIGFAIETVDGRKGVLAHVGIKSPFHVSKYSVNLQDIEEICVPSLKLEADLIVIDEIGKMELFSERFKEKVINALDTRKVLATIMESPHPFTDKIKKRDDVCMYTVTEENRCELVDIIRKKIKSQ